MTETSRRALLRASALGVVVAPFASVRTAFAAATTNLYTRSRFTPLVNKTVKFAGPTGSWSMTLSQVSDLPQAAGGDNYRFGLTFRSPVAGPLQGTYTMQRSGFTSTSLFVVPSDTSRRTYQAVINRAS
jgi:hypothetical protein